VLCRKWVEILKNAKTLGMNTIQYTCPANLK
jgi:hypothetical protein